jgi:imidazolonepropionase-like amidohydrolase
VRTVFEVDGLFDGARTMTNAAIVIDRGEVAWVGPRNALPKTPQGERAEVVQSPGQFVLPGMINCHCHLTLDGEPNFGAEVRQSDALATLKAFRNARSALRAGVTTVRDLSANGPMVIDLGRAIEKGFLEGPRVVACGRGITTTGGHGFEVARIADGPDEVRKAVREQVAAGAKVIKLFSTGGILGDGAPPEVSQYTPEETAAAVAEAHNAGLRITTHAHGSGGMRVAAEAGIDSIEHATLLDEKTVRLIKERDVAIVPTLLVVQSLLDHADALDPVIVERTRAVSARHREGVRMAHKAACGSRPAPTRVRRSLATTASRWSRCSSRSAVSQTRRPSSPRRAAPRRLSASRRPVTSARAAGPISSSSTATRSRISASSALRRVCMCEEWPPSRSLRA